MFQHLPSIDPADTMLHFVASDMVRSCSFSRRGTFVYADSVLCEATGFTLEDLIGRSLLSFIHADDAGEVATATGTWGHGPAARPVCARFALKGGGYCWLEWKPFAQASSGLFCVTVRNVTEERRLRALAAELEIISEVGTWEIDLETQFLYWSPVTFRIHDLDPGAYTPKVEDGLNFYPEEAQAEIRSAVSALMTTGTRFDLELPFVTATGRRIWVRSTAAADITGGKISRVYGTFRDITEKRAQREHLLRLDSAIQLARTTVILCDVDRRIEWVNPAFEALSGYSLAEARGQTVGSLVQCDKTDRGTIRAITAALGAKREFNGEILNRSKDGRDYWVHLNIQPLLDAKGNLSGFMAVTIDITERKTAEALRDLAEQDARRAEESLRSLVDGVQICTWEWNVVSGEHRVNKHWAASLGYRLEDLEPITFDTWRQRVHPEDLEATEALFDRCLSDDGAMYRAEYRLRHRDGRWIWVLDRGRTLLRGPGGNPELIAGVQVDISEQRAREAALTAIKSDLERSVSERAKVEQRLFDIASASDGWLWEMDDQTRFSFVLDGDFFDDGGVPKEGMLGKTQEQWLDANPEMRSGIDWDSLLADIREHRPFRDFVYRAPKSVDGVVRWRRMTGKPIFDSSGKFVGYRGVGSDVTELYLAIGRLRREAWHDPMTGLANRSRFMARVSDMFNDPEKAKRLMVLALDLDGFKAVNDTLGHPVGDQVLKTVAKTLEARLQSETRLSDHVVARFGGDEFMICGYLPTGDLEAFCVELGKILISEIEVPLVVTLGDGRLDRCIVGVSIGYSLSEQTGGNIDIFLSNADIALYDSKRRGKGVATAFRRSMREAAESRHHLTTELKAGIRGMEFGAYFQPQISLEDGKLVGVEALARWHHPERGLIGPDQFIDMAEEFHLVGALDGQIMMDAFQAYRQSRMEGFDLGKLSINASGPALREPDFCDLLFNVAVGHDINPSQVTVEILESIFIQEDTDPAIQTLQKLCRAGFGVAIDDFGVGYSSLSRISRGEISAIKIDRSLVRLSGTGNMDNILRATAAMAKGINAKLLAEGIETEAQRVAMKALGVEVGQGFLWSKPLPISELKHWILLRSDNGPRLISNE